jgi:hypothetical protein
MDIAGADMICMFVVSIISFAAIFFIEFMASRGSVEKLMQKASGFPKYT